MGKCTLLNPTGNRRVFLPKPVHAYIMNIDPFIFFEHSYLSNLKAQENHIKDFIISVPKSCNHLTRFITEYISGKKTYGVWGQILDSPIADKTFDDPTILSHVKNEFIAMKSHEPNDSSAHSVVFILRDPYEHHNHDYIIKLLHYYHNFKGKKLLIRYEDLINKPDRVACQLYIHFGLKDQTFLTKFCDEYEDIIDRSLSNDVQKIYISGHPKEQAKK